MPLIKNIKAVKIGIIGAGIAGLASAIRMACRGFEVTVFEANHGPGGKLSEFHLGDFRFDYGPSLFTMPQYVTELFELAGKNPADHFVYHRLPHLCHYFWEDGTQLKAHENPDLFAQAINESIGPYGNEVLKLLENGAQKYNLTGKIFLEQSLHRWQTWLQPAVGKALLKLPKFDLFQTMDQVHQKTVKHPKLVQLFNRFATYNGSNPYRAPGLLSMIPHFEHGIGAFFPRGGMYQITASLYELALALGVQFQFNTPVERILVAQKTANALQIGGQVIPFDRVISNMDIFYTYQKLMPNQKHPKRTLAQEKSTSALIFYWGIQGQFPQLGLHNILFSDHYKREFDLLNQGQISDDPTIYINISQRYSHSDAPPNCENWFTMINVPPNLGQEWSSLIPSIKQQVIRKINRQLETNLEPLIVEERIVTPKNIEQDSQSHLGALYGTSSNNRMAAFLRHPNFTNRIKHLYFCGGSVHPGGGIPLSLLSAKIVDEIMIT